MSMINLGKQGETNVRQVQLDVSRLVTLFGPGTVQLLHRRPGDVTPYPVALTRSGDVVTWTVTAADTAYFGEGQAELQYFAGDSLAKSETYTTTITASQGDAGATPPEPQAGWVTQVLQAGSDAAEAAARAENAVLHPPIIGENGNWWLWSFTDGVYVDSGTSAMGGAADVTAENIEAALGYTPADAAKVEKLSNEKANQADAVLSIPQTLTEAQKAQARANIGATAGEDVEFADSLEWLEKNGDTTKKYVLPDGYIYTYTQKTVTVEHNANDGTGFKNVRPTASAGSNKDANTTKNGLFTTAPIAVDKNWSSATLTISGLEKLVPTFFASLYVYYFDASGTYITYCANNQLYVPGTNTDLTAGVAETDIPLPVNIDLKRDTTGNNYFSKSSYIRVTVGIHKTNAITDADIENLVINIDRLNTEETVYGWYSTGQQHSNDKATQQNSADIATLKENVTALQEAVKTSLPNSGAVWYAIGDSLTYGLYSTSFEDYHQPVIGQRWVDYVAKHNGYQLTNLGVSGSGFVTGTTFRTVVDRNDFSEVDLVTIMLGVNDWKNTDAVNKVGSFDDDISTGGTIVSELRYGIEKIIADNPYCKIILITPINAKIGSRGTEETNWAYGYAGTITPCGSLKNFGDKLKEVCEYYGIQVIDMTNSSVVNRKSITTTLPDGIHPNLETYRALGLELARRITFA